VEEVPGVGSRLEIEVREPAVRHTVTFMQLQRSAVRSPEPGFAGYSTESQPLNGKGPLYAAHAAV
jgi:hypothetical protein